MKRYRFYMISIVAIAIIFSFATMTVNGQGERNIAMEREYYDELEDAYMLHLREVLEQKGCYNAGITMTKVYEMDGTRTYTVQIHHKRMDRLSYNEKILLQNELDMIDFGDESCSVLHKFLTYEG